MAKFGKNRTVKTPSLSRYEKRHPNDKNVKLLKTAREMATQATIAKMNTGVIDRIAKAIKVK